MSHVVKRGGNGQKYDPKKLASSVLAACLAVHERHDKAQLISEKVEHGVSLWLKNKTEVTSNDIRRAAAAQLHRYNADAAYSYLHHRIVW